jgi:hypothetical protein
VFGPLAIILLTIGSIKDSGGRRSMSVVGMGAFVYFEYLGLCAYSKQVMLTPMVCWAVGAFYARLRVRLIHVVAAVLAAVLSFGFISPLSASRDLAEGMDNEGHLELAWHLFLHRDILVAHVKQIEVPRDVDLGISDYYDQPQGSLIERLSMLPPDDELFTFSAKDHYEGMAPIYQYFANALPHFLNPNKQITYGGNFYAHEMGAGLAEDDYSTGISFSPVGEAFHCEGWGGIFWLLPVIWIMLFSSTDFVVGDMTKYPWGLMVVVWMAHAAPEQLVGGMIYFITYGNIGMMFAIVVVTRLAPILGTLFLGKTPAPSVRRPIRARPVVAEAQA